MPNDQIARVLTRQYYIKHKIRLEKSSELYTMSFRSLTSILPWFKAQVTIGLEHKRWRHGHSGPNLDKNRVGTVRRIHTDNVYRPVMYHENTIQYVSVAVASTWYLLRLPQTQNIFQKRKSDMLRIYSIGALLNDKNCNCLFSIHFLKGVPHKKRLFKICDCCRFNLAPLCPDFLCTSPHLPAVC